MITYVQISVSRTDSDPPSPLPPPPSSPRKSVQKTSVCRFKTSPCVPAPRAHVVTHVRRGAGTHGDVLNLHTKVFFCVPSRATHHTTHNTTQHHTTRHNTTRHHNTQHHTETETERDIDGERQRRNEKMKEERREKTREMKEERRDM